MQAVGSRPWGRRRDELATRDRNVLTADELDELADAWFWLDDPDMSMAVRREAYRRHVDAADLRGAAGAAWRLFTDHHLVGEIAPAAGWLERCRRHVDEGAGPASAGWLSIADADCAASTGDHVGALRHANAAKEAGRRSCDPDLTAMALQAEGRARISLGERTEGLRDLDEAMIAVTNGELQPLFTGWVYCNVVSTCYAVADLRRATEWSDEAMRWCATLREGLMYPGLCRVYAVELGYLRGDWDTASDHALQACQELTAFDPRYAGAAFCLVGDLRRVRGSLDEAEEAYRRAHELGLQPQPGLALTELARGNPADAMGALRSAWTEAAGAPLPRARLLAAVVEVAGVLGDTDAVGRAVAELGTIAEAADSPFLNATDEGARGDLSLLAGEPHGAVIRMRAAAATLDQLGFPYEAARRRARLAHALSAAGDPVGAELEVRQAIAQFERLGATIDLEEARRQLGPDRPSAGTCPLSTRELDVLRLVAAGRTNSEVADELLISHHTVARHMTNVRTKLGVGSRAAATALAYEHGWLRGRDS